MYLETRNKIRTLKARICSLGIVEAPLDFA
jgi:hypothetical protein